MFREMLNRFVHPRRRPIRTRTPEKARKPWLEALEDRTCPTVTFTNNAGGYWDVGSNWNTGSAPTASDDAVIPTTLSSGASVIVRTGATTHSLSLGVPLNVQSGSSLTVTGNATIQPGVTLTDSGTLTFGAGDAVSMPYGGNSGIVVTNGGVLSASGTAFSGYTGALTQILVNAGGHLKASNCTFALYQVYLDNGSVFNAGDLTGNGFDNSLFLPAADVQLLSGAGSDNLRFQDIDVLAGSVGSGQTLALNAIGTTTTAKLRYVFPGAFAVQAGGTLNVAANVSVLIQPGQTLTDNGTLTFGAGDAVSMPYGGNSGIVVTNGGVLSASGTAFSGYTGALTQILVNAGGHLKASNCTFALYQVYLDNGSVFNAGDLTGNGFDNSLFLPAADVQLLSGAGSDNLRFQDIDILAGSVGSGQTLALNAIGTTTTAKLRYVFPGAFAVQAGGTLNVAANVSVLIQPGQTLTDNGTLTFGAGDAVSMPYGGNSGIVVTNGGVLSASGTAFSGYTGALTQILVNAGGHLKASNCTFALYQVYLDNGSVFNAGDLTGNGFDNSLFLPAADVQLLSGAGSDNLRFQDIYILAGSVGSGQTLALNAIGTTTTAKLRYVFPGAFAIASGATLNVAANVSVLIQPGVTLTDSGTLTFGAGDAVSMPYGGNSGIAVTNGGLLTASGTAFSGYTGALTQILVNAGGHLKASNCTFALYQVYLDNGSVFNAGDLTGNGFDNPLFLPQSDVQFLSGAGNDNLRFQDIDVLAGGVGSGQTLALNAIGTTTTAKLRYVFPGAFAIASGATLNVAANVSVLIQPGVTLTDSGTLTFGAGDAVSMPYGGNSGIVVTNGGVLSASGTAFSGYTGALTQILVNAGGHLKASNCTFALYQVYLDNGSVFNAGDLTGNGFDNPLFLPQSDVQFLSGAGNDNFRFQDIDVLAGGVGSGQTLALNAIGTATTAKLRYVFPGAFAIASGATLNVAANVSVLIQPGVTLTDSGTLTFGAGDAVSMPYGGNSGIAVTNGGLLTASGTAFSGYTGALTQILVNAGGHLNANNCIFALYQLTLSSGSLDTLQFNSFATTLAINSGATYTISSNDFSNANAKVVASGGSSDIINLTKNYWGTTIATQIAAKITDHATNSALPTVLYQPFLDPQKPALILAAAVNVPFNSAAQNVTLSAAVDSPSAIVNEGAVTFTVLNGSTTVGTPPAPANVAGGTATVTYVLPAGTLPGTYTIQAAYNGTTNFPAATDNTHSLTVSAAAATTVAANASATFNPAGQSVALSATVTSPAGTVNEGTETFTILNGSTTVGNPVNASVASGAASASYTLPAGTPGGTFTIKAVYNGTSKFAGSTDTGHALTVGVAAATTAANGASATFSVASQTLTLSAAITSPAGTVNEGTETFTLLNGSTAIGSPVTVNVSNGTASANYTLPAGTPGGSYVIKAVFSGTTSYGTSTDASHTLTVSAATTTTAANGASASFSGTAQTVALSATVSSAAGTVNEGTETFTVLSGSTAVGTPVTATVAGGAASASYTLPAGTLGGTYTIKAVYNGTADFGGATDTGHSLTVGAAATTTAAANASTPSSTSAQTVALSATVSSAAGTVSEGTETFTLLNGSTTVGSPVTATVTSGTVSVNYVVPGGTAGGTYTIKAVYAGTGNYAGSTDTNHSLSVGGTATTAAAATAAATFSVAVQTVTLSATVTSGAGTVNEGSVTFTVLNGATAVGSPVTANVAAGAASAGYSLPAGTPGGTYVIRAVYNGTTNFGVASDTSHSLTVSAATATTAAANASATFGAASQTVALSATVSSAAGTDNEGTETFTLLSGSTAVGAPVTVNVASGTASANYTLPAGTAAGSYTIKAVYNGTPDFGGATDTGHTLTVGAAAATTAAASVSATASAVAQTVALSATVTSTAGTVGEGSVVFTLLSGTTTIGSPVTANVISGVATASYTLPAGTAAGTYTIKAAYSGTANFGGSTDTGHSLTVSTPKHYVVFTTAGGGVWRYSTAGGQQLTAAANATQVAVDSNGDVVAEFPGYGLWLYTDAAGWKQINGIDVSQLAMDHAGDVVAEFPGYGVGEYSLATGWRSLTPVNASLLAINVSGTVAADFPGYGIYEYQPAAGWKPLNGADATLLAIDAKGDVVANFAGPGLQEQAPGGSWKTLNGNQAAALAVDDQGDVTAEFQGAGVAEFLAAGGANLLTPAAAKNLAMDASGDVFATFPGYGVQEYDPVAKTWSQLTALDAVLIAAS